MSNYQVLARKWRPKTFDAIIGQPAVVSALINALDTGRLHHAYLFTGTRGIGKTTIARVLSKCLNCEKGVSSQPCNQCHTCQAIDNGAYTDLIEIDAASRTKVEETRALLENVPYLPTAGRFKIYLIDEVHMLSSHSFNALLKTLEEPPSHVKFILATTDPEKLPLTILSRCLQFSLRPLSVANIAQQLEMILHAESIFFEPKALQEIARYAKGSVRDSLSVLEQAIAYGAGLVTEVAVKKMLGHSHVHYLFSLLHSLVKAQKEKLFELFNELSEHCTNYADLIAQLLTLIYQVSLAQITPDKVNEITEEYSAEILALAAECAPETLQLYYQIGTVGQRDLPFAPDPKIGFEMTILRMLAFQPARILPIELSSEHTKYTAEEMTLDKANNTSEARTKMVVINTEGDPGATENKQDSDVAWEQEDILVTMENQREENTPDWVEVIQQLNLKGLTQSLAEHCTVTSWAPGLITLTLDERQKPLLSKRQEDNLRLALSTYLGHPVRLKFLVGSLQKQETPAKRQQRLSQESHSKLVANLEQDKHIQELSNTFGATIEQVFTRDLKEKS